MERKKINVRIAEQDFRIFYQYPEVRNIYIDYECAGTDSALPILATEEKIRECHKEIPELSLGYAEGSCIYQAVAESLPAHNRLLVHGASITWRERGFLFTAPSGTGKTTHISLWHKYLGDEVDIVNGDKPILAVEDEVSIYGTPWGGKENWQKNCKAALCGICFLSQGKENRICPLRPAEAVELMIRQTYLPGTAEAAMQTLELVDRLLQKVSLWELSCDMSEDAVRCSFEAMTGEKWKES